MQEPGNKARVVSTSVIPAASWGHSKSRNWEMGKWNGNAQVVSQCIKRTVECTCCAI